MEGREYLPTRGMGTNFREITLLGRKNRGAPPGKDSSSPPTAPTPSRSRGTLNLREESPTSDPASLQDSKRFREFSTHSGGDKDALDKIIGTLHTFEPSFAVLSSDLLRGLPNSSQKSELDL